jgi:hypothetical protein
MSLKKHLDTNTRILLRRRFASSGTSLKNRSQRAVGIYHWQGLA